MNIQRRLQQIAFEIKGHYSQINSLEIERENLRHIALDLSIPSGSEITPENVPTGESLFMRKPLRRVMNGGQQ